MLAWRAARNARIWLKASVAGVKGKKSKEERANALAPLINDRLDAYYAGNVSEGVSAFQARLLKAIKEIGLSEYKYVHAMKAGVSPDNRDEAGIVPFDVHDLLSILYVKGWDDDECTKALAFEIHSACVSPRGRDTHQCLVFDHALMLQQQFRWARGGGRTRAVHAVASVRSQGVHSSGRRAPTRLADLRGAG